MLAFSVLLSVYVKENPEYLDRALHSIWTDQGVKPTEIVLVQDGPLTEALDEVIDQWKSRLPECFKVVVLEENRGTGYAKNAGLKECKCPWIAIMDTDDISLPNRFQKQVEYLESHRDCDMLSGQIEEVNELGERRYKCAPLKDEDIRKFGLRRNPLTHACLFFKRDMAIEVGGYIHHLYMEDYNLCLRLMARSKMVHNLPDVLLVARVNEDTMFRRRGLPYVRSEWQLFCLKRSLGLQSDIGNFIYFILRSLPRLLPGSLLKYVYCLLRRGSVKGL